MKEHEGGNVFKRNLKDGRGCNGGGLNRKLTRGSSGGDNDDCGSDDGWSDDGKWIQNLTR